MDKLSEKEIQEINNLLTNTLSIDSKLRTQAEQILINMKNENPEKLILALLFIIINQLPTYENSAILLKNLISIMTVNQENFIWPKLSKEIQNLVKQNLIQTLILPTIKPEVCKKICNVISELESTLVDMDQEWPEILIAIDYLIKKPETVAAGNEKNIVQNKINGFRLLAEVFPYISHLVENNTNLLESFKYSLINDDLIVKSACIKAFCSVILCLDNEKRETYEQLIPIISECISQALLKDQENELKNFIIDLTSISDEAPRVLKTGFSSLFRVGIAVAKTALRSSEIPMLALEMLVSAIEKAPALLLQDSMPHETGAYFSELFAAVLHLMRYNTRNFEPNWENPKEFSRNSLYSDEEEHIVFGQKLIDRILGCTRRELGLALLGPQIVSYLEIYDDWRCKYIAFLAASRVGSYLKNPSELSVFLPIVCSHSISHPDPRIRLAALTCLKQLTEDCDEILQTHYHQEIAKVLSASLKDKIPRIQQLACEATQSCVERMQKQHLDRYIGPIMESLMYLVDNGLPKIQESAMAAIGTIAENTPDTFRKYYYSVVIPSLIKVIEQFNDPAHKKFRGQTIECITIIAKSVGRDLFKEHFVPVVNAMLEIQKHQLKSKDPIKTYLFSSWQRICIIFTTDLIPYVNRVIPALLQLILSIPAFHEISNSKEEKWDSRDTSEIEEKEEAISLLGTIIEYLGPEICGYYEKFERILISILQNPPNSSLKRAVSTALKGLILASIKSKVPKFKNEEISNFARKYIIELTKSVKCETNFDTMESQIEAIKSILNLLKTPCFTNTEILDLFEEIMKIMNDSNSRIIAAMVLRENAQICEKDCKTICEEFERENKFIVLLAQTIGAIIKSHPECSNDLMQILYDDMLKGMLEPGAAISQNLVALTIIVSVVKNISFDNFPTLYTEFTNHILKFALNENPRLQSIACEGLVAAVLGAGKHIDEITDQCFNFIKKILITPIPEQVSRKEWKETQEKAVISLSQIICSNGLNNPEKATEIILLWLQNLPLKVSKEQGKSQLEILARIMDANLLVVIGKNNENLKEILRIILDTLDTEYLNSKIAEKFMKSLKEILENKNYEEEITRISAEYQDYKKNKLKRYVELLVKPK